jgi:uncharacterized protein YjbJ (UPF0337 family)
MNRDEIKGTATAVKGKIKEQAGKLTNDPELQDEGLADQAVGNAQATIGKAKRKVGETIQDIGKTIKRS